MANRSFEMFQYRHILVRMRMGESNRALAASGLIGRNKAKDLRATAKQQGWLDPQHPLPEDETLAQILKAPRSKLSTVSLVEPYQEQVKQWLSEGIQYTTIYQALVNKYGFSGSYSSVRRYLNKLAETTPAYTTVMEFAPGESAQVDFGAGPKLVDPTTGEIRKT